MEKVLSNKLIDTSDDEINKNLSVVSFNYDRTFAHLFSRYRKFSKTGRSKFNAAINYIYGSLGDPNMVPFGAKNNSLKTTL